MQGQTEQDIKGHNLVYLHVNYNTFRLAFWILSYMLEDPKALAALKDEIDEMIESKKYEFTGTSRLTISDIEEMKVLSKFFTILIFKRLFRLKLCFQLRS